MFIESIKFPVSEVNEASAREKMGGGRPDYWEIVFWWTRKPLASARAIIAGCLLSENVNREQFLKALKFDQKLPHRFNPILPDEWIEQFKGKKLLDQFAGFGSIPLEGLRLGLNVTAVEFLPTAYIFLKAVLEYPSKYGKLKVKVTKDEAERLGLRNLIWSNDQAVMPKLVYDVAKWGNWVTEKLKEDPSIKELYEEDVAVYIGSWEIKCPHCDKWTLLVGNWWLARTSKDVNEEKIYQRLAWMKPKLESEKIAVEVVDLNNEVKESEFPIGTIVNTRDGYVKLPNGRKYEVPKSNINAKKETATCLHCGSSIRYVDPKTGSHYSDKSKAPKNIKERLEWYVKYALKLYHQGSGIKEALARQALLVKVKVKDGNFTYQPCDSEDQKILLANQEIEKFVKENNPDLPIELVAPWGSRGMGGDIKTIIWGLNTWDKHFNLRQLYVLIKLVNLIREASKMIHREALNQNWSSKEAFKYAEAITVYLAVALCKNADFNSIVNRWNPVWLKPEETLSVRGIAMMWNWVDTCPFAEITGSWIRSLNNSIEGIDYIISAIYGHSMLDNTSMITFKDTNILLDDATRLNKLNPEEKFDLIVTDPPYYDDVPYTELSDFYYVWLKRALSDIEDGRLVPKFLPEAFFKKVRDRWIEVEIQWKEYARKEVSKNPGRFEGEKDKNNLAIEHFQRLLNSSFMVMRDKLKDDGILAIYYAHTDPDAWIALLKAGWASAGFRIINAFPVATESAQRVTARGKLALDTSIVVVWRKGSQGEVDVGKIYGTMIQAVKSRAFELIDGGFTGRDLFIGALSAALSTITTYSKVYRMGELSVESLVRDYVYPCTIRGLILALAGKADVKGEVKSPESMFYVASKALFGGRAETKKLDRSDVSLLAIGTKIDAKSLEDPLKLVTRVKTKAEEGRGESAFKLLEPTSKERSSLEEFLTSKGLSIGEPNIRSSVDMLHMLEYLSIALPSEFFNKKLEALKSKYPDKVDEALIIAQLLSRVLPSDDIERELCVSLVEKVKPRKTLETFFGG
jgi:putative DNA methylase